MFILRNSLHSNNSDREVPTDPTSIIKSSIFTLYDGNRCEGLADENILFSIECHLNKNHLLATLTIGSSP
jgi:hypothetical protein